MKNRGILFILVCMIGISLLAGCHKGNTPADAEGAIETTTLAGEDFTSQDIEGNTLTMLNIWATWCPPCIAELPELQQVNEAFREKGVEVVGVLQDGITELGVPDDSIIETAGILLENAGAAYRVILPDETLQTEFINSMQYFPTTFFLDKTGTVVKTEIGAKDFADWSEIIDEILAELDG